MANVDIWSKSDWLFQLIVQHLKLDDGIEYTKKNLLPRVSLTLEWLVGLGLTVVCGLKGGGGD